MGWGAVAKEVGKRASPYLKQGAKWAGKKAKEGLDAAKKWWKGDKKKKKKDEQCPTGKCDKTEWKADNIKDQEKLKRQMEQRGWTHGLWFPVTLFIAKSTLPVQRSVVINCMTSDDG